MELKHQKELAKEKELASLKKSGIKWNSLKKINYRFQEQEEISDLLGLEMNQQTPDHTGTGTFDGE